MTQPSDRPELEAVDEFFAESTEQSRVKRTISTNYFFAWANIITRKTRSDRVAYIDLYAGPGRYVDGTKSTPLLVLDRAIADPRMRGMLVTVFNDAAPAHTESLDAAVKALPGIHRLKHRPKIITGDVPRLLRSLEKPLVPSFAFVDPYGYKGLSLRLVNAVIKDWACECLFFFNYNRINPGISNPSVAHHMEALFGENRFASLRVAVQGRSPAKREKMVMDALADALQALGARYVLPFRFVMEECDRTSHYLVFVSKNFLGYEIMRGVMGKESSSFVENVPSFEYSPRPSLFLNGRSVKALGQSLVNDLEGQMMSVREVFERHSPGKLYVMRNYKDALIQLEARGLVMANPPIGQRRRGTLANEVIITFPRVPGSGAKAGASRSTPARSAAVLRPSASARPTA